MSLISIAFFAFGASLLTLYSGFGLGTLLMPVFALFHPVETAVAATAVVHFANNLFKAVTLGGHADRELVLRFGLPAMLAAFAGAALLGGLSDLTPVLTYAFMGHVAIITPLKLIMALLMIGFAGMELHPKLKGLRFERTHLLLGGLLSGFFGGLSGHQGALRSAFLTKVGITTEAFVGSNALIGLLVDAARLLVYGGWAIQGNWSVVRESGMGAQVLTGIGMAWLGVMIGKRYLHKVTMERVQTITGILLLAIACALGAGLI